MNKIIFSLLLSILFVFPFMLSGCSGLGGGNSNYVGPVIDNSTDLKPTQQENQYTSKKLQLVTEINGSYKTDRPFTLDPQDENKRIYDDLYLYKYDFFYMGSSDYQDMWCNLSDSRDATYVETAYEDGEAYQINVKVSGIYKLIFDVVTKSFDIVYKSEITTPVYEEIENCDIYSTATSWTTMQKSGNEFYIQNYHMERAKLVAFFSSFSHTSKYKTTIDSSSADKYICKNGTKPKSDVYFMIGGTYNIYINARTYVVRVELVSADNDGYSAVVYENREYKNLELVDTNVKYIYKYRYVATSDVGGYGVVSDDVPKIFNASYQKYKLTATSGSMTHLGTDRNGEYYFKKAGTYDLIINLQDFTISVEKLPE